MIVAPHSAVGASFVRSADRVLSGLPPLAVSRGFGALHGQPSRVYLSEVSLELRRRLLDALARVGSRASRARLSVFPLIAPLAGFGCGPEGEGLEDTTNAIAVVLGTGAESYEPIEAEPTLDLIKGFQGGFHVWVSFLTYGFESTVLRMELETAWDGDVDSIVPMAGNVRMRDIVDPSGEPARVLVGWPAVIYDPTCAHGRRIRLDLTLRDRTNGTEASDTRHFVAAVPEADRAPSCPPRASE